MKRKITWVILTVFLVVLIGGASVLYDRLGSTYETEQLVEQKPEQQPEKQTDPVAEAPQEETQEKPEPTPAPDFIAVDGEGNEVSLSDYLGKPVVLNFWASWCGPCKSEMPDFNEAFLAQGEEIQFLMVNMTDGSRETLEDAMAFVADSGYSFPVLYDIHQNAAITYGVSSLPTTFFIGNDGNVVAYAMGAIDAETLQRGIEMITE